MEWDKKQKDEDAPTFTKQHQDTKKENANQ